ncbi:MAG: hypothetical protein P8I43_02840 [Bacteroidia bacterium]|nr:hypothetical protein [Bacteroidia bacterium]
MKKIFLFIFTSIIALCAVAQDLPQGIAYQAVAVKDGSYTIAGQNPSAIYWANKEIKVRFTIFERYPNGSPQFSEVHSTTTDDFGVFNLIIGQGSPLSGDFQSIPWGIGDAHLQVEIDFENTNTYTLTSIEKFWSVPYAFVTNEENSFNTDSAIQAINTKITYLRNRDQDTVIGNEGIKYSTIDSLNDVLNKTIVDLNQVLQSKIDALRANDLDTVIGNEIQSLSIKGDSLTISKGNTVKIDFPVNMDNDSTNEFQTISISNDTISLSNGGGKIGLDKIKTYIDSTSASNNDNNGSDNSGGLGSGVNTFCLDGTLVDLRTWANSKAIKQLSYLDLVRDSLSIFRGDNGWFYLHNLRTNVITKLPANQLTNDDKIMYSDSVIYIQREVTRYVSKITLYELNSSNGIDSITSFNLPKTNLSWWQANSISGGIVNKSNDLIWVNVERYPNNSLKLPGVYYLKKYDYSTKTILTYNITVPLNGPFYLDLVSGDTAIIQDKLVNSNTMTQIKSLPSSFSTTPRASSGNHAFFNGKLIYSHNYYNSSNSSLNQNDIMEYDFKTGVSKIIVPIMGSIQNYRFSVLGEHNGKLWVSVSPVFSNQNPETYFFKNLFLESDKNSIISLSKNGFAKLESSFKLMSYQIGFRTDNIRHRLSYPIIAYPNSETIGNITTFKGPPCLNNKVIPLDEGPGYFYSNK